MDVVNILTCVWIELIFQHVDETICYAKHKALTLSKIIDAYVADPLFTCSKKKLPDSIILEWACKQEGKKLQ